MHVPARNRLEICELIADLRRVARPVKEDLVSDELVRAIKHQADDRHGNTDHREEDRARFKKAENYKRLNDDIARRPQNHQHDGFNAAQCGRVQQHRRTDRQRPGGSS